jgi:tetratricopeptide (TPR) repeat protein
VTWTAAAALLLLAGAGGASGAGAQEVASTALPNGASIAFAVLRTGPESAPAPALGESVLSRRGQNVVTRVLQDRATGAYFGYRVEVDRSDDPPGFRVTFGALEPLEVEAALRRTSRRGDPAPRPLSAPSPRFPAPQEIAEGEALTLELLANPSTGERIYDVIKVSTRPVSASALEAAVARARDGQAAERRAAAHVARGRYWEAVEEYRRALEIQPRDAALHNKLGICYQQLGIPAVAEREYRQALELNPSYAEVWNNIGTLEQQRSHLKEAARAYRKAIRLKRELATPWKNLGNVYLALERPDDAFEAYQEAFRLDPTIVENPGVGIPAAGVDAATQSFYIAKLLAKNAQIDAAFEFLRRARDAGFKDWGRVRADPDFEAVVADPRFEALSGE